LKDIYTNIKINKYILLIILLIKYNKNNN